ncbi:MAG TPA: lactonase family protein [Opitutaceae bacterium]|jgi:6-phosphogluconolactonase|nr:lactonase family protein [Opitutaceae bacterium]
MASTYRMFIGTYTKAGSKGIYAVSLDGATGALSQPELAAEAPNPTYVALSPDKAHLYAVRADAGWAGSYKVSADRRSLSPVQQGEVGTGPTPCHISVDSTGAIALAANYHLGTAAAIPLEFAGRMGKPRVVAHEGKGSHPTRQTTSHVHSTYFTPDGRFAIICDLGLDRVYTYGIDRDKVSLVAGSPPFVTTDAAAGPRHLAFGKDGLQAYVITELANTIIVYDFSPANGGLTQRQTVSVLPPGFSGETTAAEVRIHPGGKFAYGSSRGSDTIAVFGIDPRTGDLSPIEFVPCGGKGPRSFTLSEDGLWLVCAHQDTSTLCSFAVDSSSGRLRRIEGTVAVSMPVCVVFAD